MSSPTTPKSLPRTDESILDFFNIGLFTGTDEPTIDFLKGHYGLCLDKLPPHIYQVLSHPKIREMIDAPLIQTDTNVERTTKRFTEFLKICESWLTKEYNPYHKGSVFSFIKRFVAKELEVEVDVETLIGFIHALMYIRYQHWENLGRAQRPRSTLLCRIDVVFYGTIMWYLQWPGDQTAPQDWRPRYHIIGVMLAMARVVLEQFMYHPDVSFPPISFTGFDIMNDPIVSITSRGMHEDMKEKFPDPVVIGEAREPKPAPEDAHMWDLADHLFTAYESTIQVQIEDWEEGVEERESWALL
jgi:hypothetical protein